MQTSLLSYPRGDRFIRIHTSILFLCDGNQTAAAMISFLEYWHNIHQQRMEYDSLMNQMLAENDKPPIIEVGGWQFHTDEQLQRGIMIAKADTIRRASEFLEAKKGFVSTDVPDRLKMLYKTGRTKWFLLMTEKINSALRELEMKQSKLFGVPLPPIHEKKVTPPKPEIDPTEDMQTILAYYNKRRKWAAEHFRNETAPQVKGTTKRFSLIIDRMKTRSVAEICLAIEGCMKSDFHQGKNDRETVYDEFERILKNDEEIDKFMKRGISSGVSLKQMEDYLSGKQSKEPQVDPQRVGSRIAGIARAIIENQTDYEVSLPVSKAIQVGVQLYIERSVGMFTATHRETFEAILKNARTK